MSVSRILPHRFCFHCCQKWYPMSLCVLVNVFVLPWHSLVSGRVDTSAIVAVLTWSAVVPQKVIRRLHLSKSKNTKFNESGQLCVFHLVSSVWSFYILITVSDLFICFFKKRPEHISVYSALLSCNIFLWFYCGRRDTSYIPAAFGRTIPMFTSGMTLKHNSDQSLSFLRQYG